MTRGWSGGALVLGKLPVPGRPTIWIIQGPTAQVGVVWTFLLSSKLSPSLWEMARYRLKYCLKGPLNTKQPTNQHQSDALGCRSKAAGCSIVAMATDL